MAQQMANLTQQEWEEFQEKYEQLRLNEEMYRVAMSLTDHTISVVDIEKHTLNQVFNEGDWTGVSVSMEDVPESVLSTGIIHPDDHEGYREFYKKLYAGEPYVEFTMRVMEENRGWVWFTMYAKNVFDENGKPVRAICFSDDITIEKRAQEQYLRYKNAVSADADFVWEANLSKDIIIEEAEGLGAIFEETYQSYSDISKAAFDAIPDPVQREQVINTFSRDGLIQAFNEAKREVVLEYQFDSGTEDGIRWLRSIAHLMTNDASEITVIVCVNDITETHEKIKQLERQAENDPLTGVFNRAALEKRAEEILENEPNATHGFLMLDIDNFKYCNDNFGHTFGDSVLKMFSGVLQSVFRSSDYIGRVGGDEFMVIMKDAGNIDVVKHRASDLQRRLQEVCQKESLPSEVTISIGIALSQPGQSVATLYANADTAMYESKKAGKNRYHVYGE